MSRKNLLGEDRVFKKKTLVKKMSCYLAHPHEFRNSPEIKEIMDELKSRGVIVINPFDGEGKLMLEKYKRKDYYPDPPYKMGREIWANDEKRVNECDMLLVYVPDGERLSGGCGIEMRMAYLWHKFIQIISKSKHPAFAYVLTGGNQMFESIKDWKRHNILRWD